MINKIKDFLKNRFGRKRSSDLSDQDSEFDQESLDIEIEAEAEGLEEEDLPATPEDVTAPRPGLAARFKDKFQGIKVPSFRKKKDEIPSENFDEEEEVLDLPPEPMTEEEDLPVAAAPSLKDKLREKFQNFKAPSLAGAIRKPNLAAIKLPERFKPKRSTGGSGPSLSPSISKWNDKILARSSREPIHQLALVLIVCGITYTLGKLAALSLRGRPEVEPPRSTVISIPFERDFQPGRLAQVKTNNIFRTNQGPGKKKAEDTKCTDDQDNPSSSLPIKLVNTVVLQDSVKSLASVQVRGGRELQEFREGEEIDSMARIFKISRLELLVKNLESGQCELISNASREKPSPIAVMTPSQARSYQANKKMSGIENVGNKYNIKKSLLDDKLKDLGQILTQARAVKIQNPDGSLAFKMTEMDPEGIFPYLGIQDGDIITSINGRPINDLNEVMSLFARIKNLENLSLGIRREGAESVQEYNIQKQ